MRTILLWFLCAMPVLGAVRAANVTSSIFKDDAASFSTITILIRIKGDAVPVGTGYHMPITYADSTLANGMFWCWDGGSTSSMDRMLWKFGGTTQTDAIHSFAVNTWYGCAMTASNVVSSTGYFSTYTYSPLMTGVQSTTAIIGTATGPFRLDFPCSRSSLGWAAGDICGIAVFDKVLTEPQIKACFLGNPISVAPRALLNKYWMPLIAQKALYSPQKITFSTAGTLDFTKKNPPLNGPQQ